MSFDMDLKTLGLSPGASWEDVKAAFRRLARAYHPDVAGPEQSGRFAEINRAYMSIREAVQRGIYDVSPGPARPGGSNAPTGSKASAPTESDRRVRRYRRRRPARLGLLDLGLAGIGWIGSVGSALFKGALSFKRSTRGFSAEEEVRGRMEDRERVISGVLDLADNRLDSLLRRVRSSDGQVASARLESRLMSRHPGVVLLALEELRKLDHLAMKERLAVGLLSRGAPEGEALSRLLSIFRPSSEDVARGVCRWASSYGRAEAVGVLRWLRYGGARDKGLFKPFLCNPDPGVQSLALEMWPHGVGVPDVSDLSRLLKSEEEGILGPLLRLIRREGAQPWMIPRIERLSASHPCPAVRVWASAIVRNKPME